MKRLITAIVTVMLLCTTVQAAGPTVSFMTEQLVNVDKGNSLGVELGYFLGVDEVGLEPFVATQWYPRWNEEGDLEPPGTLALGTRYHFADIVDPNSVIPFIPEMFMAVFNEEIQIKPYISARFTINFIDKDVGLMGVGSGFLLKASPDGSSAIRLEVRYDDTFGELAVVPDNRLTYYMGWYYKF